MMPPKTAVPLSDQFLKNAQAIRRRAMESLFERLDSVCEGALAVDRDARVVWINEKYLPVVGLHSAEEALGRDVEEIIPNSLMRQVVKTGEPILVDILEMGRKSLVVTRMPLHDDAGAIIGAIGFVLYDRLHFLKPLVAKFARLQSALVDAQKRLVEARRPRYSLADYVGNSPAALEAKRLARRAAGQDTTVLLLGETGTGKELLAQAIHDSSARAQKPFVGLNVAAIPETLLETEFFGAVPGAYTGADRRGREGKFKIADGGTLFLDEIGDMPLQLQAKLLRALQEQEIEPLGSDRLLKVDVRVIAATHVDLLGLVREGRFRSDLYYRLNVLSIRLPPLREMLADLEALCENILGQIAVRTGMSPRGITPTGLAVLSGYDWPGNVRELRNVLERAVMLTDNFRLSAEDFSNMLPAARAPQPHVVRRYKDALAEFERVTRQEALTAAGGRIPEAAGLLGISRANFYKKLRKAGLPSQIG